MKETSLKKKPVAHPGHAKRKVVAKVKKTAHAQATLGAKAPPLKLKKVSKASPKKASKVPKPDSKNHQKEAQKHDSVIWKWLDAKKKQHEERQASEKHHWNARGSKVHDSNVLRFGKFAGPRRKVS
jgi:hypothetical protein